MLIILHIELFTIWIVNFEHLDVLQTLQQLAHAALFAVISPFSFVFGSRELGLEKYTAQK